MATLFFFSFLFWGGGGESKLLYLSKLQSALEAVREMYVFTAARETFAEQKTPEITIYS